MSTLNIHDTTFKWMIRSQIRDESQHFEAQLALAEGIPSCGSCMVHLTAEFIEKLVTLSQRWFAFLQGLGHSIDLAQCVPDLSCFGDKSNGTDVGGRVFQHQSQVCVKESSISVFQFDGSRGVMHKVQHSSSGGIVFDHVLCIQGKLMTLATNVFDAKLCCNATID